MMILVPPMMEFVAQIEYLRSSFEDAGETMHGSCRLDRFSSAREFINSKTWLDSKQLPLYYIDTTNDIAFGCVSLTPELTPELEENFGFNLGYSIHPKFRNYGHGTNMLKMAYQYAAAIGMKEVFMAASNPASQRAIENSGAIHVKTVDKEKIYVYET